jgi:hypothetical protein
VRIKRAPIENTKKMPTKTIPPGLRFEDDTVVTLPSDEAVARLSSLAGRQAELENRIAAAQIEVEFMGKQLESVRSDLLPSLMTELGVSSLALSDGTKISVERVVRASISEDRKPEAFAWLRAAGHGSLIKNELTSKFGRGEEERAKEIAAYLRKQGVVFDTKESVHPQTLGAFVRERLTAGDKIPMTALGVTETFRSIVTRPK